LSSNNKYIYNGVLKFTVLN